MKKLISALIVLALAVTGIVFAATAAAESGRDDDGDVVIPSDTPVTYGYLQKFREELKKEIIEELMREGGIEVTGEYSDISVDRGGIIVLGADCELIYRGGGAAAITSSNHAGDGIGDMSSGAEIFSGGALVYGHIYFASDSLSEKAVIITGDTAFFTVRGSYEIR